MKILYVTTISNTVNAFLIPHIKMLVDEGHQVDIAFNIVQEVKKELLNLNVNIYKIPFSRSPHSVDNIKAFKELKNLVLDEKYDIVHTHTPVASAIVRLACKNIKDTRVFYTAHGFHFHKGAPILNWIIYYPIERYLSKYTDMLITINQEDFERARADFHSKNIKYVPGVGIDLNKINSVKIDKAEKRKELNIPSDAFVVLSVGELNKNKNHEIVIKALAKLKNSNIHYLICGEGSLQKHLNELIFRSDLEDKVHLLGYQSNILDYYRVADAFVFPSLREGLPVSILEAMASELPVICTSIRGNRDLIDDLNGGKLIHTNNVKDYIDAIKYFINTESYLKHAGFYNLNKVKQYSVGEILKNLHCLYKTGSQ